ncbi:MAG: sugar transferase [Clostridiales bacterium]|nr:sugar transferase [Clostridiales bacterium]
MYKHFFKRVLDIIISLVGFLLSLPIWFITIIGILINDFGPIFYKSIRVGKGNKEFEMIKFRSMRVVKNDDESSLRPDQDRIFCIGKIIRKLKIDELPQLINILKGDMAIVGPRPVAKHQMNIFRVGKYDEAKMVRPGLTGPAALYDYIYGDQFEDSDLDKYKEEVLPTRRELELIYVRKYGFLFDIKMIFDTGWCIICSLFKKMPTRLLN